jgi:hypothetical protein
MSEIAKNVDAFCAFLHAARGRQQKTRGIDFFRARCEFPNLRKKAVSRTSLSYFLKEYLQFTAHRLSAQCNCGYRGSLKNCTFCIFSAIPRDFRLFHGILEEKQEKKDLFNRDNREIGV